MDIRIYPPSRKVVTAVAGAVGEIVQSNSSGAAALNSNTTATDITNMSVTITSSGKPIQIWFQHDGTNTTQFADVGAGNTGSSSQQTGEFILYRGASVIARWRKQMLQNAATVTNQNADGMIFSHLDVIAAGTYTYKLQYRCGSATSFAQFRYFRMFATEIF